MATPMRARPTAPNDACRTHDAPTQRIANDHKLTDSITRALLEAFGDELTRSELRVIAAAAVASFSKSSVRDYIPILARRAAFEAAQEAKSDAAGQPPDSVAASQGAVTNQHSATSPVGDADEGPLEHEIPAPDGWSELGKQSVLIGLAVLFYFAVRGITEGSALMAIAHGRDVLAFEERLGIGFRPGSQDQLADHHNLATAANWIYIWGHWPVIITTLIWLHERHRYQYLLLRNAMFVSGAIGLVVFMSYPVAPPRLIGEGFVDTVTEMSTSYRILQPPSLINEYAAIPSLHVGWNLLVGLVLWVVTRRWPVRILALASPLLMVLAVMATANHYLLDALAGAGVALVGLAVAHLITFPLARRGDVSSRRDRRWFRAATPRHST